VKSLNEFINKTTVRLESLPVFSWNLLGLVSVTLIGVLDYVTGREIQWILLYMIPISAVTWFAGKRSGRFISILSAAIISLEAIAAWKDHYLCAVFFWNILISLGLFLAVVFIISELKNYLDGYKTLVETSPDPILMYDLNGKIIAANTETAKLYGVSSVAELLKDVQSAFDFLSEEGRVFAMENFNRTLRDGISRKNDYQVRLRDGTWIPVEINSSVVRTAEGKPRAFISVIRDISERMEAEKALRESEYKYRELVENANSIILRMDNTGRVTFFNEFAQRFFGYAEEDILGRNVVGTIVPGRESTGRDLRQMIEDIAKNPDLYVNNINENMRSNGEKVWVAWTNKPVLDENGQVVETLCIGNDITELRRAEDALRESEERWQFALEGAGDGVWDWNAQTNRVFYSRRWKEMLGFADQEIGDTLDEWDKRVHPEDKERVYAEINSHFDGRTPVYISEHRVLCKDGTYKWILDRGKVVSWTEEGKPLRVIGTLADITELKQTEARLMFLVTAIEQAAEGVFLTDTDWIIQYANPAFEKMLGYERGEMIGWHTRRLKRDKHDRNFYRNIRETLAGGKVWAGRGINKRKDGTFIDVEVTMSPVRDETGRVTNYVCIHRDISREVHLEAQLLQAQKMEAIGTLAGGIAHDFNNLLSGIIGHAVLMKMEPGLTEGQARRLKFIEEHVQSASELTGQLLGFARKGRYKVRTLNMNELLGKTATMFGRTRKEIRIHMRLSGDPLSVDGDRTQMVQVFMNLFLNAWQAMPQGGDIEIVTSRMILDEEEAERSYMKPSVYVKVSVTDNGEGMDEATKSRIFEPFFTTREMGRGTGLGLAMVYGIVKGHNGYINVYSEKGHGTTFNLYFPASESEAVTEAETLSDEWIRGKETILLVDDENSIIEVTSDLLTVLGYTVLTASNGDEALEIYKKGWAGIDLVILEMIMPGMSGGDTFNRLKEINSNVRVILSSGYSINGMAREILGKGCDAFIQKPVRMSELSRVLRDVLDKKV